MKIIALNLGERCGWATWDGEHLGNGVQEPEVMPGEPPEARVEKFRSWLEGVAAFLEPDLFVCDQHDRDLIPPSELVEQLLATIEGVAADTGGQFAVVNARGLEKWATGKGHCEEQTLVGEVITIFSCSFSSPRYNHNSA